jgi:hypothetical protein
MATSLFSAIARPISYPKSPAGFVELPEQHRFLHALNYEEWIKPSLVDMKISGILLVLAAMHRRVITYNNNHSSNYAGIG